jgi:hypothetical protein
MGDWPDQRPTHESDGKPDAAIVPYVSALNDAGIETLQSCSGHQHDDGTKSSGHLWFRPQVGELSVESLAQSNEFERVARLYEPEACWEIVFPGLAHSLADLRMAMKTLFWALDLEPIPRPREASDV